MRLEEIPRINYCFLPTPLEKLNTVSKMYNCTILIKRDDLTGHCFGGNKERKLEFILADAVKNNATVIVTVGALQSNHCRMTTSIATSLGFKVELILISDGDEELEREGNYFLDVLMGAKIHIVTPNKVQNKIAELMDHLRKNGEKPYFIEGGGHNVLGTIGYIYAIEEIKRQTAEIGLTPDCILLPTGTGTTQAGLILGSRLLHYDVEIIGISVARKTERCVTEIATTIRNTGEYLGVDTAHYDSYIRVYDEYIGQAYGIPTGASMETLQLMAHKEGLILDPIYNAKAAAGMFNLISKGELSGNVIYWNTGGLPALFTEKYYSWPM
ncbi:MAG: D-cysteine desulfhydrase family protein [Chloroflexota bacterium]|nr:D-cysteine desulfhydrase family protein [Chloroflexota bacterium]